MLKPAFHKSAGTGVKLWRNGPALGFLITPYFTWPYNYFSRVVPKKSAHDLNNMSFWKLRQAKEHNQEVLIVFLSSAEIARK